MKPKKKKLTAKQLLSKLMTGFYRSRYGVAGELVWSYREEVSLRDVFDRDFEDQLQKYVE